jgi:gliding motility-associated-like protein
MNYFLSIIILLNTTYLHAQINLVSNGSFEEISDCPNYSGQIEKANGWFSGSNGTPDLYNECATNPSVLIPNIFQPFISYQYAKTGKSFIGIICFGILMSDPYEYPETKLKTKLKSNCIYYTRFYVNPRYVNGWNNCFINQVGLAFTEKKVNEQNTIFNITNINPQINYTGSFIDDTLGWTKVSGCYKAVGNEQYITIGNFKNSLNTGYKKENSDYPFGSYLFIDDVGVYEFDPLPDTIYLCNGVPQSFNAHFLDAKYNWSTGNTDSVETFTQEGKYFVNVTIDGCTLSDSTIVIDTKNIPANYTKKMCKRKSIKLESPITGDYLWNDGTTTKNLMVNKAGIYTLQVHTNCSDFVYTYTITEEECSCIAFVPTAFSPNNDGLNDEIKPLFNCGFPIEEMQYIIMNRFGNTVFKTDNTVFGWDGKYKSVECEIGNYFYLLTYSYRVNGQKISTTQKGDITLIR